jgi:hypothetical protein
MNSTRPKRAHEIADSLIEERARHLLGRGFGIAELDGVREQLAAIDVSRNDALIVAAKVVDASASVFQCEVAPFFSITRTEMESCYGGGPCSPQHRCSARFPCGVAIEHSFGGDGWTVEGRFFRSRVAAEFEARKIAMLARLRAEINDAHGNTRGW